MYEQHLFFKGRLIYSFGKNGLGLTDEFNVVDQLTKLFGKDNHITIHRAFVDQANDVYNLIFDFVPRMDVNKLMDDNEVEKQS